MYVSSYILRGNSMRYTKIEKLPLRIFDTVKKDFERQNIVYRTML